MQLITSLKKNRDSSLYPFHMPGHKRRLADDDLLAMIYGIDITETEGFDDLHDPTGIIREAEERAASVFGADETHFLVNGSTTGILSAVTATVTEGDRILIAENCHRSVYNAVMLSGAYYSIMETGMEDPPGIYAGISVQTVRDALSDIKDKTYMRTAVVITSPTYEGITSDIRSIAKVCHDKGAVLIVDAAHGAHFGFSDRFPESAVHAGADIVVTSVHKTLPAMTQTALIHIGKSFPAADRLRRMLSVYMTSSPSYVLMASVDSLTHLLVNDAKRLFSEYEMRLDDLYRCAKDFLNLRILDKNILTFPGSADHDRGRIVVYDSTGSLSGKQLYDILYDKYGICPEMAGISYVTLITTIADTDEGFSRLKEALSDIDRSIVKDSDPSPVNKSVRKRRHIRNGKGTDMRDAYFAEDVKYLNIEKASGMTAADMVTVYPPGIPVVLPGEIIDPEAVDIINEASQNDLDIKGLNNKKEIRVIWERSST